MCDADESILAWLRRNIDSHSLDEVIEGACGYEPFPQDSDRLEFIARVRHVQVSGTWCGGLSSLDAERLLWVPEGVDEAHSRAELVTQVYVAAICIDSARQMNSWGGIPLFFNGLVRAAIRLSDPDLPGRLSLFLASVAGSGVFEPVRIRCHLAGASILAAASAAECGKVDLVSMQTEWPRGHVHEVKEFIDEALVRSGQSPLSAISEALRGSGPTSEEMDGVPLCYLPLKSTRPEP